MKNGFSHFVSQLQSEVDRTVAGVRGFATGSVESVQNAYRKIDEYLDSEQFEADLDEYARGLGIDWAEGKSGIFMHPQLRVRVAAKASAVVHHCRDRIGAAAASSASMTASVVRDPRLIAGVAGVAATGLALYYVWTAAELVRRNQREQPARARAEG